MVIKAEGFDFSISICIFPKIELQVEEAKDEIFKLCAGSTNHSSTLHSEVLSR
jgi:hypothetical protein